jgi:hypothetical protein
LADIAVAIVLGELATPPADADHDVPVLIVVAIVLQLLELRQSNRTLLLETSDITGRPSGDPS